MFLMALVCGMGGSNKDPKRMNAFSKLRMTSVFFSATCGEKVLSMNQKISTWQTYDCLCIVNQIFLGPHLCPLFWVSPTSRLPSDLSPPWPLLWWHPEKASQMCVETTCKFSYILKIGKPNINPLKHVPQEIVPPCGTASKLGCLNHCKILYHIYHKNEPNVGK